MSFARSALLSVFGFALLAAASPVFAEPTMDLKNAPSGVYQIDPNHASVTFKIIHMGFSRYTGRFDKLEGTLNFNNADPEKSTADITVYPNSIDTNNAKLEEELRGDKWLDVIKYPRSTFHVTKIERTGPTTGKITGDLTLMGTTHSFTMDATLIGTGNNFFSKKPVIGISAVGTMSRSDFGFNNMIPMVSDDVVLEIEAEFDKAD